MAKSKEVVTKEGSGIFDKRLPYFLIAAISALIYFNTIPNGYALDDELVTINHRLTKDGISAIPEIFKEPYYKDNAGYAYEYRPMVLVSFAIENSVFDEHPSVSHFINVVLYTLLCTLLLYYLRRLLKNFNTLVPLLITAFFAVHPIHTEVVASIKNRDELLALLFAVIAAICALKFFDDVKWYWLPLMMIAFLASLLSKQTTVVFIALVPLAIIVFRNKGIKQLALIVLLLALVAVPVINITAIGIKLGIVLASAAFLSFVYLFKNDYLTISYLASLSEQIKHGIKASFKTSEERSDNEEEIWPVDNKEFFTLRYYLVFVLPVILLVGLDYFASYAWNAYAIYAVIILLWAMLFKAPAHGKVAALAGLFVVMMNVVLLNSVQASFTYYVFIILSVLLFFYASKPFKWLSVIFFIVCAALLVLRVHDHWFPVLVIMFALFGRPGKLKVFTYVGIAVVAISFVYFTYSAFVLKRTGINSYALFFPFMAVVMFLRYRKASFNLVLVSAIVFLAAGHTMTWLAHDVEWPGGPGNMLQLKEKAKQIARADAVNINPESVNRPIRYIEIPVSLTDPLTLRLGTASDLLWRYLKLVVIPYPMAFYYGYSCIKPVPLSSAEAIISILIHLFLLIAAFYFIKKEPLIGFGILFYLIGIAIYTDLLMPVPGMLGNRFLLIPSLGFCFVLAAIILKAGKFDIRNTTNKARWSTTPAGVKYSALAILLIGSVMTMARNSDWKDYLTLFRTDIKHIENSAQAQNLLALHLFLQSNKEQDPMVRRQLMEEAIPHFKKALEVYPQFLNASFDLARDYDALQRPDEAYEQYRVTCTIDTSFITPYFAMGIIQQNKGNYAAAVALYQKFLTRYPTNMVAFANLSFAYFKAGQYDLSIATNQHALQIAPNSFDPTVNIGKTYLQMNKLDSALVYFKLAQKLDPNEPNVNRLVLQLEHK